MEEKRIPTPGKFEGKFQKIWDVSSLNTFQTCPEKYHLSVLEGWKPRAYESVPQSSWGHVYHKVMEKFDLCLWQGMSIDDVVSECVRESCRVGAHLADGERGKNLANIQRSIIWYAENWSGNYMPAITLHDGTPAIETRFEVPFVNGKRLSGRVDKLYQDPSGLLWIVDHKTTDSSLGSYYFRRFTNDNQKVGYIYALRKQLNMPVAGFIIDACQNLVNSNVYARQYFELTDAHIDEWLMDICTTLASADAYASDERWPRSFQGCFQYSGCPYINVCSKIPEYRTLELERNFKKDTP